MKGISKALACLPVLLVLAVCASAQSVVVVQPGAMNGWNYATANYGESFLTNILPDPIGAPNPSGAAYTGAFYGATHDAQDPAGQVWLGTDAYGGDHTVVPEKQGTLCSDIDTLTYWTYTEPSGWENSTQHYVKQPFMLQITLNKAGTGVATRTLVYRPWGLREPMNGQTWTNYGVWQFHDCMTPIPRVPDPRKDPASPQYDPGYAGPDTLPADPDLPGWYEFTTKYYGDWDFWFGPNGWYPNARIAKPAGVGTGFDTQMNYTGTGYSMNFQVGARKLLSGGLYGDFLHPEWPEYAWWAEGVRFKGYVDDFTIGVNGVTTTYDFQGGTVPRTVCLTANKAIKDYCADRGKVKFYYKVHGRVLPDDWTVDTFTVEDASGQQILVKATQHGVFEDDYVSASGKVDTSTDPPTMNSSYEQLKVYPDF